MTPDLTYLALTAALSSVLWIPYILGTIQTYGLNPDDYRVPPQRNLSPFLTRANRAHLNLTESLPVFASLVLVAHVSGEASAVTATAAAVFFWARIAHAVVHLGGWPYVRTLAFATASLAQLAILWEIFT